MFSVNQNKGFALELPNGWTVSVQFGGGNYCDHRSLHYDVSYHGRRGGGGWSSKTAEIAAWPTNYPEADWYSFEQAAKGKGKQWQSMSTYVEGWQTMEEVLDFINTVRAFPKYRVNSKSPVKVEEGSMGRAEGRDRKNGKDGKEGKGGSKELSLNSIRSLSDAAWYEEEPYWSRHIPTA